MANSTLHGRTRPLELAWQGRGPAAAQSSYEAAVAAQDAAPGMRARLRAYMRLRGSYGATDAEIEKDLGWDANIVTARRNDLVLAGEIVTRWPESRRLSIKRKRGKKPLRVTVWILATAAQASVAEER
jgi:hypothetical protein